MRAFWKITRYARAARFWLLLALAAFAWLGFGGDARAQDYSRCASTESNTSAPCPSVSAAIAGLNQSWEMLNVGRYQYWITTEAQCTATDRGTTSHDCRLDGRYRNSSNSPVAGSPLTITRRVWKAGCPPGTEWNETTMTCGCPSGTTFYGGSCTSCSALNDDSGFSGVGALDRVRPFKTQCLGGCTFEAVPMQSTCTTVVGAPSGTQNCSGRFAFTGAACTVGGGEPAEVPPPQELGQTAPQECIPAGSGQTFCQKPNGQQCYTASTGKQICWGAGETGDKGDGPIQQTRNAGDTPILPNLTTPSGDSLSQQGDPVTTVTTRNNTTTTTTTTNYITEHGTDARPDNSGESDDGTDETSADGGADCGSPPIVSGDAALHMVANQAWATRCAVEAGNAASVSGDVGDCQSPFTVEGTNANAEKLRAMRAQICGASDPNGPWDVAGEASGVVDGVAGSHGPEAGGGQYTDGVEGGGGDGELDESGLGWSRSCPTLPVVDFMGTTIDFNATGVPLCDWIQLGGQILLILSALLSVRILASGAMV